MRKIILVVMLLILTGCAQLDRREFVSHRQTSPGGDTITMVTTGRGKFSVETEDYSGSVDTKEPSFFSELKDILLLKWLRE